MSFNAIDGGSYRVNATSVSIPVVLRDPSGNVVTGKIHSDMTGSYRRQGGARVAITMATLAAADSAYSEGGFKEIDATNQQGLYRFDIPNAALVHGADDVVVSLQATGVEPLHIRFALTYDGMVRAFTPQALGAGTLTLDAGADAGDGAFLGKSFIVAYSDDPTDLGAMFLAHTSYTGATKVALGTWTRVPTGTVGTMVLIASTDGYVNVGAKISTLALSTQEAADAQTATEDGLAAFGAALEATAQSILADTGTDGVVLANNAITAAKIAANAIAAAGIADGAITPAKHGDVSAPAAVPTFAGGVNLAEAVAFLLAYLKQKQTLTLATGAKAVRNEADSADIATATDASDGTTVTKGALS